MQATPIIVSPASLLIEEGTGEIQPGRKTHVFAHSVPPADHALPGRLLSTLSPTPASHLGSGTLDKISPELPVFASKIGIAVRTTGTGVRI